MSNENLVFVYGSLKRNHFNHDVIAFDFDNHCRNKGHDYLGKCSTVDKFIMYDMGSFPAVAFDENGSVVEGELFAVDDKTMDFIDALEGYPEHYSRKEVSLDIDEEVKAWIFYYENPEDDLVEVEPSNGKYVWEG